MSELLEETMSKESGEKGRRFGKIFSSMDEDPHIFFLEEKFYLENGNDISTVEITPGMVEISKFSEWIKEQFDKGLCWAWDKHHHVWVLGTREALENRNYGID